jgi:hypothetical protein
MRAVPPAPPVGMACPHPGYAGCGLSLRDVINRMLATAGVQLKSKATVSERRVRVTLDDGQTVEHTLFWLAKTTPAGVLDPDDADADGIIGVCSGYV